MTKRDLFKIAIRLFALLSLVYSIFQTLPILLQSNLSVSSVYVNGFVIALIIIVLIILFFRFLFLHTDKIIDWLRLDKGFDDDQIVLGESSFLTVIKVVLIVFGLNIFITNVPSLLSDLYSLFKSRVDLRASNYGQYDFNVFNWYYYITNSIVACLFIFNYEYLAEKIIRFGKRKK